MTGLARTFGSSRSAAAISLARIGFGAGMTLRPGLMVRLLSRDVPPGSADWLVRMVGVRELALGAGALWSLRAGGRPVPWLAAAAVADAGDAAALSAGLRAHRVRPIPAALVAAFAAGGAAAEVVAAVATRTADRDG